MRKRSALLGTVIILVIALYPSISLTPIHLEKIDYDYDLRQVCLNPLSDGGVGSNLTWTSRTQQVPQLLENESIAVGDHVVLNATFPDSLNITHCEMRVWSGFTYTTTRPLVVPTDPGGVFSGIIDPAQFDWVVIKGIEKNLTVNISCNFTNTDSDFMAWDGALDQSEYTYSNNMLNMVSGNNPETDSLIWTSDNDTMVLGCLNYDCTEIGNWTLNIQVGIDAIESVNASSIGMDTYYITGRNQSCFVCATGYTDLNESIVLLREQVRICNFFAPNVTIYPPVTLPSDDKTYNISWSCFDRNADDVNYYSVWISSNDGYTYLLVAQNLTRTWHLWNSTGWFESCYTFRVRAYSLDFTIAGMTDVSDPPAGYWPGDYSDGIFIPFEAGEHYVMPTKDVGVHSASYIAYSEGENGNYINWTLYFANWGNDPDFIDYKIYRNRTLLTVGRHVFSQDSFILSINVDGLLEGTYKYLLSFRNPGSYGRTVRDEVFVFVDSASITPTPAILSILQLVFISSILPIVLIVIIIIVNKSQW